MYKFMNNPYLHSTFYAPDGAGLGSGADGGGGDGSGENDDPDNNDDPDGQDDDPEEKKFSQKDIDEAVKKRLAREKRKWQRNTQNKPDGGDNTGDNGSVGESELDKRAKEVEEKAANLEMKWTCLEHDVKKDCVDDVLALAKVHMNKDKDMDIEDAIDAVLKKYPHFKSGTDDGSQAADGKRGWGQRQGGTAPKTDTVDDVLKARLFGN